MKKYILVFLLLSTLKSSFIYTDINFSNNLNSIDGELGSSLLGYSHLVYTGKSDNFNLYFGLSHTITPIVIKNNNIYSSESNLGIIDDYEICEDVINPKDTEINFGNLFMMTELNIPDTKYTSWFKIGLNIFDVNYFQLSHQYTLFETICVENCDNYLAEPTVFIYDCWDEETGTIQSCTSFDDLLANGSSEDIEEHYDDWAQYYIDQTELYLDDVYETNDEPDDICYDCVRTFNNIKSYGGISIGFGVDYNITENLSLSLSNSINVNKKIINYSESVFDNKNIDFDISRWSVGLKYHF